MKDYFNLTIEEKKALAEKRNFRPAHFAKAEETTTSTTTNP
jgi:hypothetical protein